MNRLICACALSILQARLTLPALQAKLACRRLHALYIMMTVLSSRPPCPACCHVTCHVKWLFSALMSKPKACCSMVSAGQECSASQAGMATAAAARGFAQPLGFVVQATSIELVSSTESASVTPNACQRKFGHFCIDHSPISRTGIIVLIVFGSIAFVLLVAAAIALSMMCVRRSGRRAHIN